MATVTAMRKPKVTVGSLIDELHELREQRRAIAKQDDELKKAYDLAEQQLIGLMDAEGVVKSTGKTASAGIDESIQFKTLDWQLFMPWMAKNKLFHLVQQRVSAPSVREVFEKKGAIPGLEPYTKRIISLRNL